jgi:predicted short-subunit dehydrogenase-like oxidoreductase (DUF2520 family)
MRIVIIGAGRAGTSLAGAFHQAGYDVTVCHHDELHTLPSADAIVLCVPDDAIATVASLLPRTDAVVMHVAGSRTLNVLGDHERVASMHPLVALPNGDIGQRRLSGSVFAVAGDHLATELVRAIGGRPITLRDEDRVAYHAAACIAANHLVTLLHSVGELADGIGMSLEDFLPLAQSAIDDAATMGPLAALTGPASRGDLTTIDAHLAALPDAARPLYVALANEALVLGETQRARTRS